jgi:hypothetical protein
MSLKDIAEHIRDIVKDNERTVVCTVKEVSNTLCVCEPIDTDLPDIQNVRLCSEEEDAVILPIPKVGSQVIVVDTLDGGGYIAMFGELESLYLRGDQYGGLVKIEELVTKLNNLENKVNTIINTLNSTVIPLAPSGTYPLSSNFSSVSTLTTTNKSDIENDKVKHG